MKKAKQLIMMTVMIVTIGTLFIALGISSSAATYGDLTYSEYAGEVTITGCNEFVTSVEIPSEIGGKPVTSIGGGAFKDCISLQSITIPSSVTSIGRSAFEGCRSLESITIPDSVISIGVSAFYGCRSLHNITIPDSVTCFLGFQDPGYNGIFSGCTSLQNITIPVSLISVDYNAFYNCSSLQYIFYKGTKSDWNSIEIKDSGNNYLLNANLYCNVDNDYNLIDNVLYNKNNSLLIAYGSESKQYVLPDTIKSIEQTAFKNSKIQTIILNEGIKNIGSNAFYNAKSLTSIYIPSSISTIDANAFYNCSSLTDVYFGGTQEQWNAISIGNGNNYLKNANIHFNEKLIEENGAIYNESKTMLYCYSNTSTDSFVVPESVQIIKKDAFKNCYILTSIELNSGLKTIEASAFEGCANLTSIVLPNTLEAIGNRAFYGCNKLCEITVYSVISIGEYAFSGCTALTDVSFLGDINSIGNNAFGDCTALTELSFSGNVETIGNNAFSGCTALAVVSFAGNVKSIGNSAFSGCSSLTDVAFSGKVNTIGSSVFSGCTALEEITLPEGITTISSNMFYNCTKLNKVNFSSTINTINSSAFEDCTNLTYISLPDTITSLGSGIFKNCSNLEKICIPEGTLSSVPANTFNGCGKLTSIYIPENITAIGDSAFLGCNMLSDIYFGGTQEKWDNISIISSNSVIWASNIYYEHSHTPSQWVIIIPSVDGTHNVEASTCSVCGYEQRQYVSYEHIHNYNRNVVADVTCSTDGVAEYVCTCSSKYYETIVATGHTFTNEFVTEDNLAIAATCHTKAKYFYKCENCNVYSDTLTFEYGEYDANNHDGGTEVRDAIAPTCGDMGYTGDTYCIECYTKIATGTSIKATGIHSYISTTTSYANCVDKGVVTLTCKNCNDVQKSYTDINPNNHKQIETDNAVAATCISTGLTEGKHCAACNEVILSQYTIPKEAHSFTVEVSVTPSTCSTIGHKIMKCVSCEETEKVSLTELGEHSWNSGDIIKEANCRDMGIKLFVCSICAGAKVEYITADSNIHKSIVDDLAVPATCTAKGLTEGKHCSACNTIIIAQIETDLLAHRFGEWVVESEATETEEGICTRKCEHCGKVEKNIIDIDSNDSDDINLSFVNTILEFFRRIVEILNKILRFNA